MQVLEKGSCVQATIQEGFPTGVWKIGGVKEHLNTRKHVLRAVERKKRMGSNFMIRCLVQTKDHNFTGHVSESQP